MLIWIGLALLVVAFSLWPHGGVSDQYHLDKVGHFSAYAALSLLPGLGVRSIRGIIAVTVLLIIVGAGLEAGQYLVPGRHPSLLDFAANAGGVLSGLSVGTGLGIHWARRTAGLSAELSGSAEST